ncbi:hypothetical protein GN958_ATG02083 [Phytophthora infestans]|uniref:Uncharacterized protein n=1 Tax=Phytophthora infestans TaxID=4787 RepID=A0A8S9V978_PHYIN|nr:hypothetical protein GN958_ATG02083 [Phytophthora infestans]
MDRLRAAFDGWSRSKDLPSSQTATQEGHADVGEKRELAVSSGDDGASQHPPHITFYRLTVALLVDLNYWC